MTTGFIIGLSYTSLVTINSDNHILYKYQFGKLVQNKFKFATYSHPCNRYILYYNELQRYFKEHTITGKIVIVQARTAESKHYIKTAELKGVYLIALEHLSIPYFDIHIINLWDLKRFFLGERHRTMYDLENKCKKDFKLLLKNRHEAAAFGAAYIGENNLIKHKINGRSL